MPSLPVSQAGPIRAFVSAVFQMDLPLNCQVMLLHLYQEVILCSYRILCTFLCEAVAWQTNNIFIQIIQEKPVFKLAPTLYALSSSFMLSWLFSCFNEGTTIQGLQL